MLSVLNIAAYRFVSLKESEVKDYYKELSSHVRCLGLKGTILLSTEGINLSLAGPKEAICDFQCSLNSQAPFENLSYHSAYSKAQPFQKMVIKLKKQIIAFPLLKTSVENSAIPYLKPTALKALLDDASSSDFILLDARNEYEVAKGSFQDAIQLHLKQFRDFPKASQFLPAAIKEKIVITFCTGGIRCEKAGVALIEQGFKRVYQLEGGILNYFEQCHNAHYQGGCFVFDEREVVYPSENKISNSYPDSALTSDAIL